MKIEDLWYRFALSYLSKIDSIPKILNLAMAQIMRKHDVISINRAYAFSETEF
jgi:hypothetical protein